MVREDGKILHERFLLPHPEKCQKQSDMAYGTRGDRGGKVLVFDGYKYQKNRTRGDNIHWRCWRETCRAPLQTNDFNVDDKGPELQRLSVTVEVLRVGVMIVGVVSVGVMTVGVMTLSRFSEPAI